MDRFEIISDEVFKKRMNIDALSVKRHELGVELTAIKRRMTSIEDQISNEEIIISTLESVINATAEANV